MKKRSSLLLTTFFLLLGLLLVLITFNNELFDKGGLTGRKAKKSSRFLDPSNGGPSGESNDRHTKSIGTTSHSSIYASEDGLLKNIAINGDEVGEHSMNDVLSWVFESKSLPYSILGLNFSDRQKCEIVNHYLDFVFSGNEFEPVMNSLVFIKSDLLRLSMKSKISAAAVRKGNIQWALTELNVAAKGPERNSQLRAIIDSAAVSDLDDVTMLLKGLSDPIEIREAQLSFSKWLAPKIDDKRISEIKPEDVGHDFYPLIKKEADKRKLQL